MTLRLNDIKISADFSLREYECPCCHAVKVHPKLAACCQRLRDAVGQVVTLKSAYRCQAHNAAVGGKDASFHMDGMAADPTCAGLSKRDLAEKCLTIFPRVGLYWRTDRRNGGRYLVLHCDVADPGETGLPAKFGDGWGV
jgi:uncharacterized protein YcbK (DUF882 family)